MSREPDRSAQAFDSTRVSASRVGSLMKCGIAFKLQYLDGVPEEVSGSAALFGSVVHKALEHWSPDRKQDLLPLMRAAWREETAETSVRPFLEAYEPLSAKIVRAEHECRQAYEKRAGKPSVNIHMAKEWKQHPVSKELTRFFATWLPRLEAGSPWRFTERDPLPSLYNESLVLAKRYEAKWKHLPPTVHTEFKFEEPWRGFTLRGYIDTIEPLIARESAEVYGIGVVDYKTYRKAPAAQLDSDLDSGDGAELKDWRQLVMYDVVVRQLVGRGQLPLPYDLDKYDLLIGIDYVRTGERRFWRVTEADYDRLERELKAYKAICDGEAFLPADKNANPDFCPFPSQCCLRSTAAAGGGAVRVEVSL